MRILSFIFIAIYLISIGKITAQQNQVVVWDGESPTKGVGWVTKNGICSVKSQTYTVHSGKSAVQFTFKSLNVLSEADWIGAGWNWVKWQVGPFGTDITTMKYFTFWLKVEGVAAEMRFNLLCNGAPALDMPEHHTEKVLVSKYCPQWKNGEWNKVIVPLKDLVQPAGFDPKHVAEMQFFNTGNGDGSFFIDDLAFEDGLTAQIPVRHSFVCTDYTQGKVCIISDEGKLLWQYDAENCNDLWVLPNGNLLFNTGHGVKEVTRDKKVVFNYESKSEIYACQRLANGNTFIGECNSGFLLEVAPGGQIIKKLKLLPEGVDGGHAFMRNARKLENGNYLVAHYGLDKVSEYDSFGKIVREIPIKGGPHSVIRLPNGNTLIACSDHNGEPRIVEVDTSDSVVWQITKNELPGIELKFMTGMEILPNGNLVFTNWIGHNQQGKVTHAFEITRDKKVVWIYDDQTILKTMSAIQILDSNGIPLKDKILSQDKTSKYSVAVAQSFIKRFPNPDTMYCCENTNHFSWQAGYVMFAMEKIWRATGDPLYYNYIKRYVDQQVDEKGNIPDFKSNALDNFLPGYAILFMYEQTHLEKYKIAAMKIRTDFDGYPRNKNGLFWHGTWATNQVWVDGLFMGQIFLARYGETIGDKEYAFNEVVKQITTVAGVCQKENGLLLHGWDESKKASWANKTTGLAPEVWSEGLGWYAVLLADIFDYLPKDHQGYASVLAIRQKLCEGIKNAQDPKTGMWCQVVDQPNGPGNWNETSGTGMYIYLLKKSIAKGFLSADEYSPIIKRAYAAMVKKAKVNDQGFIDLYDCSSIGIKNNYQDYIHSPKEISPFGAFGSFIISTTSIEY